MKQHSSDNSVIDPEPFSIALAILGAVGSVASIIALFHPRRDPDRPNRQVNINAIRDALMGAETALNELRAQARSLEIAFEAGTSGRANRARQQLAKFGNASLLFTADGHHTWRDLEQNSLGTVSRLQRHMGDVIRLFATSSLILPEALGGQLHDVVGRLNGVVERMPQMIFENLFRELEESAHAAMAFIRELRHRLDGIAR